MSEMISRDLRGNFAALGELLSGRGYKVLMTRKSVDEAVSLRERCRRANEAGAQCFVSVHCNSVAGHGAGRACGIETWCREGSTNGRWLAGLVQGRLAAVTGARDRGVKASRELFWKKFFEITAVKADK